MVSKRDPETYDDNLIDHADRLLMSALRGGHLRLAVQCDVCGRWLTATSSVRRHRGPSCTARNAVQVVRR